MTSQHGVQLNLLPAVKIMYLKARKTRQVVMMIALGVMIVTVVIVLFLLSLLSLQSRNMTDLKSNIESELSEIKSSEDLEKLLTLQSQLVSLPALHESKTDTSNIFGFLNKVVPVGVALENVAIEHETTTLTITGNADTLELVNVFADTLKFTTFTVKTFEDDKETVSEPATAFSEVTTSADRSEEKTDFVISAVFDPQLFMNTHTVALQVPSKVTSRSVLEQPTIFNGVPTQDEEGEETQ